MTALDVRPAVDARPRPAEQALLAHGNGREWAEYLRGLVLGQADLAARLRQLPGYPYADPKQWSGFVPPAVWNGAANTTPWRSALKEICTEAIRRHSGDTTAQQWAQSN